MRKQILFILVFIFFFSTPVSSVTLDDTIKTQVNKQVETKQKEIKARIQEKEDEIKHRQRTIKTRVLKIQKEAKERIKIRDKEFREKLKLIKDERKRRIVDRINTRMGEINKKRTDRLSFILDKLKDILDRIDQKVQDAANKGFDTSVVNASIIDARNAVGVAEDAVVAQAGKEYVIKIESEDTLRAVIGPVVSQMRKDLKDTTKAVKDAIKLVRTAAHELVKLKVTRLPIDTK